MVSKHQPVLFEASLFPHDKVASLHQPILLVHCAFADSAAQVLATPTTNMSHGAIISRCLMLAMANLLLLLKLLGELHHWF